MSGLYLFIHWWLYGLCLSVSDKQSAWERLTAIKASISLGGWFQGRVRMTSTRVMLGWPLQGSCWDDLYKGHVGMTSTRVIRLRVIRIREGLCVYCRCLTPYAMLDTYSSALHPLCGHSFVLCKFLNLIFDAFSISAYRLKGEQSMNYWWGSKNP